MNMEYNYYETEKAFDDTGPPTQPRHERRAGIYVIKGSYVWSYELRTIIELRSSSEL